MYFRFDCKLHVTGLVVLVAVARGRVETEMRVTECEMTENT